MVRKKLALAILALSALQADLASALGLGSLSVKSSLNQPLNAEIRLLDTGDLDPAQIKIRLAAQEDFERAGVDRNYFLTNLKFEIDMDGRGSGVIHITTREPVVEPYLNFVVEARWPSGRLLREFAVLLDPPTFSGGAAQAAPRAATLPAAQPAVPSRQLTPPTVTAESTDSTAERLESKTLPESTNSGEHRVQVGETLSQIASRFRPATDVTAQQTMLAIQRANPDAFIQNNINLVRAGAILRLPNAEEARAVAAGDAGQAIAEQSHAWRGDATSPAGEAASGPQLDASQPQTSAEGGYQEKERLTIATPGNSAKSSVGEGSGSSSKGVEALRNQLTASQESLDSAKRDNKEMQSRLDDMERQVATLQRLIALKDDQLSALQSKAAQSGSASAPTTPATSEPAVAQVPSAPESAPVAEAPTPVPTSAPTPAPAPAAAKPKPVAKPAPQPMPEPSLVDQLLGNPLYLGGGVAALLLAIGGAVFMKKRREQLEEENAGEELDLIDYAGDSSSAESEINFDNALVSDDAIADADSAVTAPASAEPEKKAVRSETGDAIAEADIYIAYGRYQQAVDLLTGAIDAEPNRTDLRVKLLEVLLEMRNRDAFRQQFMALQSLGDADAVVQVKEMLSSVDGVSDWLNDLPTSSSASAGVSAFALGAAATTALPEDTFESEAPVDLDLELDLDDSLLDTPTQVSSFADVPASTSELSLDLGGDVAGADIDLDLDAEALDFDGEPSWSESAPATDLSRSLDTPFDESSAADDLELDLDDSELELDLNEEDLDFALKAMEGDETPAATHNLMADAGLSEFDLSVAGDELSLGSVAETVAEVAIPESAEEVRQALEADLGDLGDLGGLDDLGDLDLDDVDFAADTDAAPAFEPSFESSFEPAEPTAPATAPAFAEPAFAELEPEPTSVAAAQVSGDDFDFLSDTDEVATKLDLARAYIDMGDTDGAKDILGEVLQEGSDAQKQEAGELMDRIA